MRLAFSLLNDSIELFNKILKKYYKREENGNGDAVPAEGNEGVRFDIPQEEFNGGKRDHKGHDESRGKKNKIAPIPCEGACRDVEHGCREHGRHREQEREFHDRLPPYPRRKAAQNRRRGAR